MRTKNKKSCIGLIISMLYFNLSSQKNQEKITNSRLKYLLLNAKKYNKFYKKLYKNIDVENITKNNLSELPTTSKTVLMENFDDWANEFNITKKEINNYKTNKRNSVCETSGTTGEKTIIINDKNETKHEILIGAWRVWYNFKNIIKICLHNLNFVGIFPIFNTCSSTKLLKYMSKSFLFKNKINLIDISTDVNIIVEKLNNLQPTVISSYSTMIDILLDETKNKNLNINPKAFIFMGETIKKETIEKIKLFYKDCKILSMYATTETGQIAYFCPKGHYHINEDWIIVEPADKNNNILPNNVWSDKIFVTSLWKYKQPIIRYEINDRCKIHYNKCKCGNKGAWLEISGRNDELLKLKNKNSEQITILPMLLEIYLMLNANYDISKYQFIFNDNKIEIRLDSTNEVIKQNSFNIIKENLEKYLKERQIEKFVIYLSDIPPQLEKNGKFKRIKQI